MDKLQPVAWINKDEYHGWLNWDKNTEMPINIPLYTHPVKELDEQFKKGFEAGKEEGWKAHKFHYPVKELTDEEIDNLIMEVAEKPTNEDLHDFARAILRKASEK